MTTDTSQTRNGAADKVLTSTKICIFAGRERTNLLNGCIMLNSSWVSKIHALYINSWLYSRCKEIAWIPLRIRVHVHPYIIVLVKKQGESPPEWIPFMEKLTCKPSRWLLRFTEVHNVCTVSERFIPWSWKRTIHLQTTKSFDVPRAHKTAAE